MTAEHAQAHPDRKDKAPEKAHPHPESHTKAGAAAPGHAKSDELERLKLEVQQANDRHLRALADVENTKKRLNREKEEFAKYAAETVVRGLLPILDSLDQALVAAEKHADPAAIRKGVELIHRQLLGLLSKEGVERIATVGAAFDPHKHEAVSQIDVTDGTADDTVMEEVQVGYAMHGKVIRPAMVKVAKRASTQHTAHSKEQTKATISDRQAAHSTQQSVDNKEPNRKGASSNEDGS